MYSGSWFVLLLQSSTAYLTLTHGWKIANGTTNFRFQRENNTYALRKQYKAAKYAGNATKIYYSLLPHTMLWGWYKMQNAKMRKCEFGNV